MLRSPLELEKVGRRDHVKPPRLLPSFVAWFSSSSSPRQHMDTCTIMRMNLFTLHNPKRDPEKGSCICLCVQTMHLILVLQYQEMPVCVSFTQCCATTYPPACRTPNSSSICTYSWNLFLQKKDPILGCWTCLLEMLPHLEYSFSFHFTPSHNNIGRQVQHASNCTWIGHRSDRISQDSIIQVTIFFEIDAIAVLSSRYSEPQQGAGGGRHVEMPFIS